MHVRSLGVFIHLVWSMKFEELVKNVYLHTYVNVCSYMCTYVNTNRCLLRLTLSLQSFQDSLSKMEHCHWAHWYTFSCVHNKIHFFVSNQSFLACQDFLFYVNWETVFYTYKSLKLVMPFQLSGIDPLISLL